METFEMLEARCAALQRQYYLLSAVVVALMDGMKDHEVEEETGLPEADCDVIRRVRTDCRERIDINTPLTEYSK